MTPQPYPYGMCEIDADLYGEDCDPAEMLHDQCATVARQRDDQLSAEAMRRDVARDAES